MKIRKTLEVNAPDCLTCHSNTAWHCHSVIRLEAVETDFIPRNHVLQEVITFCFLTSQVPGRWPLLFPSIQEFGV
jgi:hypothetical protein